MLSVRQTGDPAITPAERAQWGLSHQLYFDLECMIMGFVGLIDDQIAVYGRVSIIARRVNQDSLESLFGSLRYLCGGGNDPNAYEVHANIQVAEAQRRDRRSIVRKRNTRQA